MKFIHEALDIIAQILAIGTTSVTIWATIRSERRESRRGERNPPRRTK